MAGAAKKPLTIDPDEALLQVVSQIPGIVGNPYLPHWPTGPQLLFLSAHLRHPGDRVFQALYGGAAGGGKSDALLMSMAQMAWLHGDFSGICFRRSYTDLIQPGALLDRAMSWWIPKGVAWSGTDKQFRFPNGAKVAMSYLWGPQDHLRYQGAEYHATAWDELTQWGTAAQYEYVGISRVRRKEGCQIPLRTLATSNPGGPGHAWVRDMFVGIPGKPAPHTYIPARLVDNPHLDRSRYEAGLSSLHPTVRRQLLDGDWQAREPGDYFRPEWFGPLLDPEVDTWSAKECIRVRWWDLAASEKADAARTAGVRMARHISGVRAIEHCRAFRATPGKRDDLIVQTAQADGHGVVVGIEIEGGSGGLAQFLALEKRLKALGFRVAGARPIADLTEREAKVLVRSQHARASKIQRADPVASCLERGYQRRGEGEPTGSTVWGCEANLPIAEHRDGLRLFSGPWTAEYLDELVGFPDGHLVDVVDATTGAWAYLEAHPAGGAKPLPRPSRVVARGTQAVDVGVHPDERREEKPRFWTP